MGVFFYCFTKHSDYTVFFCIFIHGSVSKDTHGYAACSKQCHLDSAKTKPNQLILLKQC